MSRLSELCKELKIGDMESLMAEVEFAEPKQYLTELFELALQQRRNRRISNLIKRAGFPSQATLTGYDFAPVSFPDSISKDELLSLGFVDKSDNICMLGSVGTGKTHLATALGVRACTEGKTVRFVRAATLANELVERHRRGEAAQVLNALAKADLLILDELGYVPFSKQAAELLFTVISNAYEHQSLIVTSNLEFGRWNEVFGDNRLTAALIDRVVHHAHILAFSGQSYRFRQAMSRREGESSE